jgi:hypothetical protein
LKKQEIRDEGLRVLLVVLTGWWNVIEFRARVDR